MEDGGEFAACLRYEIIEWTNPFFLEQFVNFFDWQSSAGNALGYAEISFFVLIESQAFVERFVVNGGTERGVYEVCLGFLEVGCFLNEVHGHLRYFLHELFTSHFFFFNFSKLVFPFAGQAGARKYVGSGGIKKLKEIFGLESGVKLRTFPSDVLFLKQVLDGRCSGRRCSEAFFLQGFRHFLVIDQFPCAFHGRQKGCFAIAWRGLGHVGFQFRVDERSFVLIIRGERREAVLGLIVLSVDSQPGRFDQNPSFGLEGVFAKRARADGDVPLGRRIKNRDETLDDQVVDFQLVVIQTPWRRIRGNNGEVIADLLVVENPLVFLVHPIRGKDELGMWRKFARDGSQHLLAGGSIVFGQSLGIGSRIGDGLVSFVKRLCDLQGSARRQMVKPVGFFLQGGQVVEAAWALRRPLLRLGDVCRSGLLDLFEYPFRFLFVPQTVDPIMLVVLVLLEVGSLINPAIFAFGKLEACRDFVEGSGDEISNFNLPFDDEREGGGLYPADGGNLPATSATSLDGYGPGTVYPDQPIRFGPAAGRILQGLELLSFPKIGKCLLDGLIGHGKHPQPLDRFGGLGQFVDVGEDEFTLASGIAGVDHTLDILSLELLLELLELLFGGRDRLELELGWDNGEIGEFPSLEFLVEIVGHVKLDQMPDGTIDHPFLIFKEIVVLWNVSQYASEITSHTWLFGDD